MITKNDQYPFPFLKNNFYIFKNKKERRNKFITWKNLFEVKIQKKIKESINKKKNKRLCKFVINRKSKRRPIASIIIGTTIIHQIDTSDKRQL